MGQSDRQQRPSKRPWTEWVAGGIGLVLTCGLLGFIGWQALQDAPEQPRIVVRETGIVRTGDTYLVEITAFNRGDRTVSALNAEGVLTRPGQEPERSMANFDYVPGHSQTRGGLYFSSDPATGDLQVRATGYQLP